MSPSLYDDTDEDDSPSEIAFLVHKDGRQAGPYSQDQILSLLQEGHIGKRDLVYYEGLGQWKPIEDVFHIEEQLSHFMNEGQDPGIVAEIFKHLEPLLGPGEEMYYIAHQKKKMMRSRPDAAVLTNKRFMVMRHKLTGVTIEECQWKNVFSVSMREGLMGTTFTLIDTTEHVMDVEDLPREQLARLAQLAQEMRG